MSSVNRETDAADVLAKMDAEIKRLDSLGITISTMVNYIATTPAGEGSGYTDATGHGDVGCTGFCIGAAAGGKCAMTIGFMVIGL